MVAIAALLVAPPLQAQNEAIVARADTLLIAGRVFAAESLYYIAVRRGPRDPVARLALGRYLAQRGALKVGAVLMEEARFFGGDPTRVAVELAHRCGAHATAADGHAAHYRSLGNRTGEGDHEIGIVVLRV